MDRQALTLETNKRERRIRLAVSELTETKLDTTKRPSLELCKAGGALFKPRVP